MEMFKIRSRDFAAKKRSFEDKRRFNPHYIGDLISEVPGLRGHFTAWRMINKGRDFASAYGSLEIAAMCSEDPMPSPPRFYGPEELTWGVDGRHDR
jgi:hypothetical protein